ncbi:MAG TPA: YerC/YecD family TrpR-related protein [Clostridia bacterium]|nr:YerC/YecD family TrpR-related protein [Clostridia bacterium]
MYESKLRGLDMNALFGAVLTLENEEDCYRFFEDLCTINELMAMSQRFAVARLLKKGETYTAIAEKTGASTATISRVNRCLVYGASGYTKALERLGE